MDESHNKVRALMRYSQQAPLRLISAELDVPVAQLREWIAEAGIRDVADDEVPISPVPTTRLRLLGDVAIAGCAVVNLEQEPYYDPVVMKTRIEILRYALRALAEYDTPGSR